MEETTPTSSPPKTSQRGITTIIAVVIIGLLVVGGVIAFGMNQNKSASQGKSATPSGTATNTMEEPMEPSTAPKNGAKDPTGGAREIIITGKNYSFSPSTVNVKKGETVILTFKNAGGFHDFVIDDLKIKTPVIAKGNDAQVTITVDKPGSYEFYCSVGNHKAMGMKGTIVVTE